MTSGQYLKRKVTASLASSGESDDGGLVPPPRKKTKVSVEDTSGTMHQQANGSLNGSAKEEYETASSSKRNGNIDVEEYPTETPVLSKVDEDIVRLIGQHLKLIGLK